MSSARPHADADAAGASLRLRGRNLTETEHVKLGSYHTLELEPQRAFTLEKAAWDAIDIERIQQATDPAASADLAAILITVSPPSHPEGGGQGCDRWSSPVSRPPTYLRMQIWQLSTSQHLITSMGGAMGAIVQSAWQRATVAAASAHGSWCCYCKILCMHAAPNATCSTIADVTPVAEAGMPTLWCCSGACARMRSTHCNRSRCHSAQRFPAC